MKPAMMSTHDGLVHELEWVVGREAYRYRSRYSQLDVPVAIADRPTHPTAIPVLR
jgi:hypothetical protein